MKKGFLLVPLLTSAVLLGGCGNSQVSHSTHQNNAVKTNKVADQNNQKNQSSATAATTTTASDQQEQSSWNQSKNQKLASFMQKWGTTMNQQYKSYGPGNNTNFYGIAFPQQFDQTLLKVDNQTVSMKWSNDGTGNADYNVVAIYCDSDTAQPMNEHLYLFTFHNSDPVVLITQQTNGNVTKSANNGPDDGLHFKETANQDLRRRLPMERRQLLMVKKLITQITVARQMTLSSLLRIFQMKCKERGMNMIKALIQLQPLKLMEIN